MDMRNIKEMTKQLLIPNENESHHLGIHEKAGNMTLLLIIKTKKMNHPKPSIQMKSDMIRNKV